MNDQKDRLRLTGLHVQLNQQRWPVLDSVVHLGPDALGYDVQHLIYDGVERVVVDFNTINDWSKWIDFVEQGQSVLVTISADSVTSILQRLASELKPPLFERLIYALNGILVQKFVGAQKVTAHEVLILRLNEKVKMINDFNEKKSFYQIKLEDFGAASYQSLNQALIQKLIRRKIDVKAAFSASIDPDQLDSQLKKLGL